MEFRLLLYQPKGCHECSRRRIRCDQTEPRCLKCQKKGLNCSGQGIRYQQNRKAAQAGSREFTSRSQLRKAQSGATPEKASPRILSSSQPGSSQGVYLPSPSPPTEIGNISPREVESLSGSHEPASTHIPSYCLENWITSTCHAIDSESSDDKEVFPPTERPLSRYLRTPQFTIVPESLDARSRTLFHHFSEVIAPVMVVLNSKSNGYRDIILPIACQDEVVRGAVAVVAAHHIAGILPKMQNAARAGQMAVISRLRTDALQLDPSKLFNMSTWATILVLLVGETITGGDDFVYLLEMLTSLTDGAYNEENIPPEARQFFQQQTKMFQLFGFPLSHETKGVRTLQRSPEYYLDFINNPPPQHPSQHSALVTIKEAISIACRIYQRRAEDKMRPDESIALLRRLRHTVADLDHHSEGAHALVWTYFVAAAESTAFEDREFFANRLLALYERTQFRSIPAAFRSLQRIWTTNRSRRWTDALANMDRILVM